MARKEIIGTSILLVVLALVVCSCAPNQRIVDSSNNWGTPNAVDPGSTPVNNSLEKDI
ncbi:MAG: hypothetical protein ABL984_12250 [Pyrinomonadaceae bacterium]